MLYCSERKLACSSFARRQYFVVFLLRSMTRFEAGARCILHCCLDCRRTNFRHHHQKLNFSSNLVSINRGISIEEVLYFGGSGKTPACAVLLQASADACCAACNAETKCNVWVWCGGINGCSGGGTYQECWLKHSVDLDIVKPRANRKAGVTHFLSSKLIYNLPDRYTSIAPMRCIRTIPGTDAIASQKAIQQFVVSTSRPLFSRLACLEH